ncbi:MAG: Dipeptide transport system permease protein DppC [uncultured Solirubrobacteraceae bacterium]|uniref:Dipeptide transport system permease protein DppC n=1 Tax=uncultured Solirubrobacteraceae bacterium TaxID=1162706 RepID=A0A6J4TPM2_9ACTN|nr:MAG: Dipeptide transport system permease protein DppC [uncultured Solirubrobacteraceae bacterium]
MAFISLLVLTAALCLAAPLYASVVADTTQLENHLTDTVAIAGEQANVVDLDGTPIGPTWRSQYLLGADGNGRDLAVRVLYAGRNSLAIGFAAGVLALVIGTFVGMLAGYAGGRIDRLLMRAIGIFDGSLECHFACGNLRDDFVARLPVTVWVVLGGVLLAVALSMSMALACLRHHGRRLDRVLLSVAAALQSVPSLVLSVVLWTILAQQLEVLPFDGYTPLTEDPWRWATHLIGPWFAMALPLAGAYVPIVRAALLDTHRSDWVRTARAKGLSERRVRRRHVLRTSLAAPVNIVGLDLAHAFGGLVLYVEAIFRVPGVGEMTEGALQSLDVQAIVALSIWIAIVVVTVSAVVDLVLFAIDPRTRVE